MRVIVNGALGRMGKILCALLADQRRAAELAGGVDRSAAGGKIVSSFAKLCCEADCIVDFSFHTQTAAALGYALEKKLPIVVATTGHTEEERAAVLETAKKVPVFFAGNLSLGAALLARTAQRFAAAFPDADVEIVECHHAGKADAPSGTALMLGQAVREARGGGTLTLGRQGSAVRQKGEITIHSLRLGTSVGWHELLIHDGAQSFTLRHEAHDRAIFAEGALIAAEFLLGKETGLYTMKDIVE